MSDGTETTPGSPMMGSEPSTAQTAPTLPPPPPPPPMSAAPDPAAAPAPFPAAAPAPAPAPASTSPSSHLFTQGKYNFRKKLKMKLGADFQILDASDNPIMFSHMKAFKLKEDIRIYSDEAYTDEILTIKSPKVFDLNAKFEVTDPKTGENVGALRRKALMSIISDEWLFLDHSENEFAKMAEPNMLMAILARFINLIPQQYECKTTDGQLVATAKRQFNPFFLRYDMEVPNPGSRIDGRLLIAAGILLLSIEGRQG